MSDWISFFSNKGPLFHAAGLICSGAAALMMVTYTQGKDVYKTKNTVGLPKRFLAISCCTCVLLGMTSIFGLCDSYGMNEWKDRLGMLNWVIIDVTFILINICLFGVNLYCLKVKKDNMQKAERAGMQESDYYVQVIQPSLPREEDLKRRKLNRK